VVANHLGACVVPPFGTLTGFVREGDIYDTEAGVAGALVELSSGQSATTEANGRYTLDDVPAGDVSIAVSADGMAGERAVYVAADDVTWGSVALLLLPDAGAPDAGLPTADAGVGEQADSGAGTGPDPADDSGTAGGCALSALSAPSALGDGSPAPFALMLALCMLLAGAPRRRS